MAAQSRIKHLDLADLIDEGTLAWHRHITPITEHYAQIIAKRDYAGKKLAYWGHITFQNMISLILPLKEAGAEIVVGACNVDSTDDPAAAYMASKGVLVYGWSGMSQLEYQENLTLVRRFEADYLCDMGGELSVAYLDKEPPVKGALEATMTGLHLVKENDPPFPIFDWNSIPLKNLHNRFHVGDSIWPVFSMTTKMGLFGRRVLVIGFGPVGKGIAERARNLGASVYVTDLDPVRLLDAGHFGCETVSLEEGISRCEIIVTATGVEDVFRQEYLQTVRPGTIVFNAGHSNHEIDIDWLYQQPHCRMKAHIERFDLGDTYLFLLAQGSLLNLATGTEPCGVDQFDHYTAIMLLGIAWMFDGIPDEIKPGLQRYPSHLEKEIAALSVQIHNLH